VGAKKADLRITMAAMKAEPSWGFNTPMLAVVEWREVK
jgi:hypothetical protein